MKGLHINDFTKNTIPWNLNITAADNGVDSATYKLSF